MTISVLLSGCRIKIGMGVSNTTRDLGCHEYRVMFTKADTVDHVVVNQGSGIGSWLLILGCPREQSHELHDEEAHVSGPTFAYCAHCEYQVGTRVENYDSDAEWTTQMFPERLKCGYCQTCSAATDHS